MCTKCKIAMKRKHKSSIGAITQETVMSGAAVVAGGSAGIFLSQKLVPMIAPTGTNPWITNVGRVAVGIVLAAVAPSGMVGDLMRGAGAGIAGTGGYNIINSFISGQAMVAGPYMPTTAIGRRYGTVAGPVRPTTAIGRRGVGMVRTSPQPTGAAISLN